VLIVSIDTLRADRVGRVDGSGRSLTPSLDALAAESAVFTEAYSAANETLYAHAALFTGKLPSTLGPADYSRFSIAGNPTIASTFHAAGYRTEAVVAGGHLAPEFGLSAGFDRYASGRDFGSFQQTVPLALARLDALAGGGAPWLLFVHGYDVHAPYVTWGPLHGQHTPGYDGPLLAASLVPWSFEQIYGAAWYPDFTPAAVSRARESEPASPAPDALQAWAAGHPEGAVALSAADVAFVRGQYDAAVRYADFHVGVLLSGLHVRGLDDNTIVVVLSDHGEDLLEHGHVNHRLSLDDETLHVPLLLRVPGIAPSTTAGVVGLIDVLPTLAALAGVASPETQGRSLFTPEADRAIRSESASGEVSIRTREGRAAPRSGPAAAPSGGGP
jgi:arylsulfatase A-like enzyme